MAYRTPALLALFSSLAAGCAAGGGTDVAVAADTAPTHDAHVEAIAEARHGAEMDGLFGVFARGESAIYRGRFSARDNAGVLPGEHDGAIADEPAVASLGTADGKARLSVYGTSSGQHVDFFALGAGVQASLVLSPRSSGGLLGACTGCLPDLGARPAAIRFASLGIDGHYLDVEATPFRLVTTADLARVAPAEIALADLLAAKIVPDDFVPAGEDLVRRVRGATGDLLPAKPGALSCWLETDYSLDEWVRRSDVTKFGTRGFSVDRVSTCCADPHQVEGGVSCNGLDAAAGFATGVGASVSVALHTEVVTAEGGIRRSLRVVYRDAAGYFHGGEAIRAVATVHRIGPTGDEPLPATWTLAASPDGFAGEMELPDAEPVLTVDLAFADVSGARWDSDLSRNYHVRL